jgi:hypothetical protein
VAETKNPIQVLQSALDEIAATGATDKLTIRDEGCGQISVGTADEREVFSSMTFARQSVEGLVEEVLGIPRKLQLMADYQAADYQDFMQGHKEVARG